MNEIINGAADLDRNTAGIYAALLAGELAEDEALRASRQMLQMVMACTPHAIWWKGLDLRYLGCNKVFADFAGVHPDDMVGKSDLDFAWANHEAEEFRGIDREVIRTKTPLYEINEQIHGLDGEIRLLETNKVPLIDFDGNVVGVLGTFQDVTVRRQAELELKKTLNELDERVRERTSELSSANHRLQREIEERTRLQEQERKQLAYAEALRDSGAAINRSLDMDDVLEQVVQSLKRLLDFDIGAVLLAAPDATEPRPPASLAHSSVTGKVELDGADPDGRRLAEVAGRIPGDSWVLDESNAELAAVSLGAGSKSMLVTPISLVGERMGYLVAESSRSDRFDEHDAKGIRFIAGQAASALTNVRLVKKATELAALDERQRLARELHDAVSQTLWTACLSADSLSSIDDPDERSREIEQLRVLARGALAEIRNLVLELRPSAIEEALLSDLAWQLVAAFSSRKQAVIHSSIEDIRGIAPGPKLALYRIMQESLNNVARHVTPEEVWVTLRQRGDWVETEVVDDGGGFDVDAVPAGHLGLKIMKERAESNGGTVTVTSNDARTTVLARIPLDFTG